MVVTKEKNKLLKEFEKLDLGKMKSAIRVMDKLRKKHKLKRGEKTSVEIIRKFRNTLYHK